MRLPEKFRVGRLEIDLTAYRLLRDGELIHLTRTEWALLQAFAQHHGQVMTHRALLQRVWGTEYGDESDYIHTYVRRLRLKLEDDAASPQYLLSEPGIGYRLEFFSDNEPLVPVADVSLPAPEPLPDEARRKFINPLPQDVSERFVGRHAEHAELTSLLLAKTRLVTILGRSGVGKTALVCKVLNDLQGSPGFDGMVYLSADRITISMGRVISDFARLLNNEMLASRIQELANPAQRAAALLDQLSRGNYILLLDNFESLQNPLTGELIDPELATFFTVALEQGSGLRIIVTSRLPLALPLPIRTWERVIALDEGLSPADGAALLRRCDPDGLAGLRDADEAILRTVVEKTRGFPRALEAVVGLLLENHLLTVDDILTDEHLFAGEIGAVFVQGALERLDREALSVMEALALFDRPVTLGAVAFLLEPFIALDSASLRAILNRLLRAFFCTYNRASQTFSLHAIDRHFCYQHIPTDGEGYSRQNLHRRAASYYAGESTPSDTWQSPADLEAQRQQFHHLVCAGDDDAAARLLLSFDAQLAMWGQFADLRAMHERLRGQVSDPALDRQHQLRLGDACRALGQIHAALESYRQALQSSRDNGGQSDEAEAQSRLGWAYYDLGQFETAINTWEEALGSFRALENQRGEGSVLGGLGWVSYLRGDYAAAVEYFRQAWDILIKLPDLYSAGINLGDLGAARAAQGQYDQAIGILNEALSIADRFNSPREKSYKRGYLAMAMLLKGDLTGAHEVIGAASKFDVPENNFFIAALYGVILARLNRPEDAIIAFNRAIQHADELLHYTDTFYRAYYARGLARAGLRLLSDAGAQPAAEDYRHALRLCAEKGVVENQLRLLDELMRCPGGERLASIRVSLDIF